MKSLVILTFALSSISAHAEEAKKVSLEGISRVNQMIGYLNMPYGTIITVTGRVKLVPENTGQKGGQTRYFIVTHIEDKKLHKEIIFDLWSASLPKAKHGDIITAKSYERLMMLGVPEGITKPMIQARTSDLEFRLYRYIHILPQQNNVPAK